MSRHPGLQLSLRILFDGSHINIEFIITELWCIMMGLNDRYDYEFQYVILDYSMDYSIE